MYIFFLLYLDIYYRYTDYVDVQNEYVFCMYNYVGHLHTCQLSKQRFGHFDTIAAVVILGERILHALQNSVELQRFFKLTTIFFVANTYTIKYNEYVYTTHSSNVTEYFLSHRFCSFKIYVYNPRD